VMVKIGREERCFTLLAGWPTSGSGYCMVYIRREGEGAMC
jgi:hypothetical protein